jgi:hypothetical protein
VPAIATDDPARGASGAYYPLDYHEVAVVVDDMQRQLKMPIDKSTDVVFPYVYRTHTHNSFLSSRLSFASSLAFLFAKQTENVGRKRERKV